ncbi:hypothetical protein PTTG_27430 [Puccinia triticina 1-1 BBBD Race 1]|uniref:Uncharacterized protein n=1 Tax=Puccinia triticina (isolate 1-1 / race 1 (BBBD)) TaxID=630390 RepID=A0A180GK94_PUCT1|nr:hypothetical protein PTTG_27430 [Puccinia triticina 1-1 BBBD Race 1]
MVESRRTEESKRAATSPAQPREFSTSTSGNYKPQLRAAVPSSGLGGCAAAPAGQQLNCLRAKDPDMYQLCKGCLGLGTSALIDCLSSKTACPARPPPGALGGCTKFTHGQNLNCLRDNDPELHELCKGCHGTDAVIGCMSTARTEKPRGAAIGQSPGPTRTSEVSDIGKGGVARYPHLKELEPFDNASADLSSDRQDRGPERRLSRPPTQASRCSLPPVSRLSNSRLSTQVSKDLKSQGNSSLKGTQVSKDLRLLSAASRPAFGLPNHLRLALS